MALPDPYSLLLPVAAIFVLAGFVKGVVGMGLPTIAMGLLSLTMPPAQAAALLVVPSLLTNLWQIAGPHAGALLRRLTPLLLGVCLGTWAGAGWLGGDRALQATAGLGLALLAYALLGLADIRFTLRPAQERWLALPVGIATGLVTAATGVFVIPAVPYLQALGLEKDELVRALGLSFLVSTLALALNLGQGGMLGPAALGASALAVLPALLGMGLGQALRQRVSAAQFRRLFFCGLLALGAWLLGRALAAGAGA